MARNAPVTMSKTTIVITTRTHVCIGSPSRDVAVASRAASCLDSVRRSSTIRQRVDEELILAPRVKIGEPEVLISCYVVAPATANTLAKLALGIADNQALTTVCEAIGDGTMPVIVFPRINAAHARHPAWVGHLAALRSAGVHLIYGEDVWPLHEPRKAAPSRQLPWSAILKLVDEVAGPAADDH